MRGVGPKIAVDDQGVAANMDEAEEDYDFLVHLLRRYIVNYEIKLFSLMYLSLCYVYQYLS